MTTWTIGFSDRERVTIELLSPPVDDVGYDWILARARVDAGGFHGDTQLTITLTDLVRFRDQLDTLNSMLTGTAEFTTVEDQIRLKLIPHKLGQITLEGHLMDNAGMGNRLEFSIGLDQTFLKDALQNLSEVIELAEKSKGEQSAGGYGGNAAEPQP